MIPGIGSIVGIAAPNVPVVTSLGMLANSSDLSAYSFGNISVPRAGILAVFIGGARTGSGTRTVTGISIGGSNAAPTIASSAAFECGGMRYAVVAAGDSAIAGTFSSTMQDAGAHCWLIENCTNSTPYSTYAATRGSTNTAHQTTLNYVASSISVQGDLMLLGSAMTSVTDGTFDGSQLIADSSLDYHIAAANYSSDIDLTSKTITFISSSYSVGVACGMVFR